MRYTVNLDTSAVSANITRLKAGGYVPTEIVFQRNNASVALPTGWAIEYTVREANKLTGGSALIYHNAFASGSGNIYSADVNATSPAILTAMGLTAGDGDTANDKTSIPADVEIAFSVNGLRLLTTNYSITIEAPRTVANAVAIPDPVTYPAPAAIALKSDLAYTLLTAAHNAVAGELLSLDLRAAAITVTLPATPAALAIVRMRDLFGAAATHNLTVNRNGHSIGGVAENLTVATANFDFELIYDGISNWQITRFQ